ncbi:hypothetical protein [Fangia hongkongensis]|uniref:hypothetical protein n=1 Tax=Fangia hongkongensis TaxID=270495 RepID=UPI0012B5DF41|nr:hypothetical protein [Fangia hongkongensis]MBK2125048.1 hypothetical protein [Fangia hongkongensis]
MRKIQSFSYIKQLKQKNQQLMKDNKKLDEINSYLVHELNEQYNIKYQPTYESEYDCLSVDEFVDLNEEIRHAKAQEEEDAQASHDYGDY